MCIYWYSICMVKKKKKVHKNTKKLHSSVKKIQWDIKRIFLPLGVAVLTLFASTQVVYTQGFTSDVLGDEDKAQEEQQKEAEKHQEEQEKEQEKQQKEFETETETETETADSLKVKTKVEDNGVVKTEIEAEKIHFKFEEENGEVKLRVEDGEGTEVRTRVHTKERDELEQELEDEDIRISSEDGKMEIEHNAVRTRMNFPLSMDSVTRELIVTTPEGERTLAVLPDEVLNTLIAKNIMTPIASGSGLPMGASSSAEIVHSVELKMVKGNLVYEVEGKKKEKFFGILPVSLPRTVTVSALSGEVLSQTESLFSKILGILSF